MKKIEGFLKAFKEGNIISDHLLLDYHNTLQISRKFEEKIKLNQESLIAKDYGMKPSGLKKLKKDLVEIESCFSSDAGKEVQILVRFARGIRVILQYFGI